MIHNCTRHTEIPKGYRHSTYTHIYIENMDLCIGSGRLVETYLAEKIRPNKRGRFFRRLGALKDGNISLSRKSKGRILDRVSKFIFRE
jgi:hypothetical protein